MPSQKKNATLQLLIGSAVTGIIVTAAFFLLSGNKDVEATPHNPYAKHEEKFQKELEESLISEHSKTRSMIKEQGSLLSDIKTQVDGIADKLNPVEEVKETETVSVADVSNPVPGTPVRMHSSRWSVEGRWDYSTDFLAKHLAEEHGIAVAGYPREELQIIHDNIHNGFDAMGGGAQPVKESKAVVKVRRSSGLFGGRLFGGYRSCPTGGCR